MTTKTGEHVLVTGGAGFIGSHTVDLLVSRGCRVVVVDDFSTGKRENLTQWLSDDRVHIIEADIADGLFAPLASVEVSRGSIDRVVHLAAQTSVIRSIDAPLGDVRTNHVGAVQVFEYARHRSAKQIVFASSAAVYGDVDTFPVLESAPLAPMSPYGIHKRVNELWARYAADVHDLSSTGLRFFNVYGPRQDPHSPYSGVISIFAERARSGHSLIIFGDGEQSRDFVYVGDVARAICDCVLRSSGDGGVFNIGTGRETSVNELAEMIVALSEEQFGRRSEITRAVARPGEIQRSVASIENAQRAFGYAAETALEAGLEITVQALAE